MPFGLASVPKPKTEKFESFWFHSLPLALLYCHTTVLQEAFQAQHGLCLPTSMTQGVITLLYRAKASTALLDNHRPITLLNGDYKLLAKALATRFANWACMCWTPLIPLLCLVAGLATMCCTIWRRWSTCSKQVSLAALLFWTSARRMTALAPPRCTSRGLTSAIANGSVFRGRLRTSISWAPVRQIRQAWS